MASRMHQVLRTQVLSTRRSLAPRSLRRAQITSTSLRAFSITPFRLIKEDADRHPHEVEAKKQEQLKKQEKGEGHWHEELASGGESNVKADREEVDDHGEHMEELQKQTKEKGEKGHL